MKGIATRLSPSPSPLSLSKLVVSLSSQLILLYESKNEYVVGWGTRLGATRTTEPTWPSTVRTYLCEVGRKLATSVLCCSHMHGPPSPTHAWRVGQPARWRAGPPGGRVQQQQQLQPACGLSLQSALIVISLPSMWAPEARDYVCYSHKYISRSGLLLSIEIF